MQWDITFCSNKECKNINCPRNLKSDNAKSLPPYRPMYVADFTDKCKRGEANDIRRSKKVF